MPFCAKCNHEIPLGKKFCRNCGLPVTEHKPDSSQGTRCPYCTELMNPGSSFCGYCGKNIGEALPALPALPVTKHVVSSSPVPQTVDADTRKMLKSADLFSAGPAQLSKSTITTLIVVTVAVIVLAVGGGYFYFFSEKRSIITEAKGGNLAKPDGTSAYDLYLEYVKGNPGASDLAEIANVVVPILERRGEELLTTLKHESIESETDWAEGVRIYAWLHDLRPNAAYESRKYFSEARLQFLKGQNNRAIENYQRAIQLDSSWALPLNGLARAFLKIRDRAAAKDYYQRAAAVEPDWIFPWINLGALSYQMNDYSTAEVALRRALALDTQKASAHFFLGQTLDKMKRPCEAVKEYRIAIDNAPKSASPGFNVDWVRSRIDRIMPQYSCN